MGSRAVIFSDLDGTLLHPVTYSSAAAFPALRRAGAEGIPVVFVSSKTRAEIEGWRLRLGNTAPFVSENGGGIFVPPGQFPFPVGTVRQGEDVEVLALGTPYSIIREVFILVRETLGIAARGFGDMTVGEIGALTGLDLRDAELAKAREFDEPFVFDGPFDDRLLAGIEKSGLRWTRGRLYHAMGASDKGRAVRKIKAWYERLYGRILTIAVGDGFNDLPMLAEADHPVLVRREDGTYDPDVDLPGLIRTEGVGPAGWNEAILSLVRRRGDR